MYLIQKGTYEYVLSTYWYVLSTYWYVPEHTYMYQHMLRMYKYVLDTDQYILVCTCCVPVHTWMYGTEACLTGFSGAQRDANTRMPDFPSNHRFAVL
jgi:hypothetical protein